METSLFLALYGALFVFPHRFAEAGVIKYDINYAPKVTKEAYGSTGPLPSLPMEFQLGL